MTTETVPVETRTVPGPSLFEFIKGSGDFPAFHFYDLMMKYGNIVKCGSFFYLINSPDMAKDIFRRDQKELSQDDFIGRRVNTVFGYGMVTSQGNLWKSQRKLLSPVFSYKRVHEYLSLVIDQIDDSLIQMNENLDKSEPVDLADQMGTLSIMTAGKLLFQTDFSRYVDSIKSIVEQGTYYIAEGLPFYLPLWVPSPNHLKLKKIGKQVDEILEQIIENVESDQSSPSSMAGVLKKRFGKKSSSEYEHRLMFDEMKTMLAGGYFPVSCTLSMVWYCLGQNPQYMENIQREIDQKPLNYDFNENFYDDFPMTTSVIFETMRLYPVAFSIWRKAKVDFITHGYLIPKGKSLCISLFNLHRNPECWTDPEKFLPERFLDGESKRPKHCFMPFGWGNRKCIGDHYAIMVVFLSIIKTLQKFKVKVLKQPLEVKRAAMICPKQVMAELVCKH